MPGRKNSEHLSGLLFPPKRKMSTLKIPVLRKWPHLTAHQEKKINAWLVCSHRIRKGTRTVCVPMCETYSQMRLTNLNPVIQAPSNAICNDNLEPLWLMHFRLVSYCLKCALFYTPKNPVGLFLFPYCNDRSSSILKYLCQLPCRYDIDLKL